MGSYDAAQICLNGHVITDSFNRHQDSAKSFCSKCGESTITECPACNAFIRGHYESRSVGFSVGFSMGDVPSYCHECGKPYPWTQRRTDALWSAVEELEELSPEEREKLKKSIPDIIAETPMTPTAALRIKKALAKLQPAGKVALVEAVKLVAVQAVKSQLGI